ncbi:hypothetical protein CEP52_014227 [Fusarium oligoseptatum]|uniref:Carrier domain-containing protein n=1 Tax=Fusarium oligoseptatum TaxID=2604345 RepID=A0A428SNY1_9HYPO|nr:hypothetical protein CEP52_014227 [Fusarium oligoseptatum]
MERALQCYTGQVVAELGSDASTGDQFVVLMLHIRSSQPRAESDDFPTWLHLLSPEVVQQLLQLRECATNNLIAAMMPIFWIPVNSPFPHNENSEIDRRAIKSWIVEFLSVSNNNTRNQYSALHLGQTHSDSASTQRLRNRDLGRTLIECWAKVFCVPDEEVNAELPFLHVGGDNISAIRFVSLLWS